MCLEAIELLLKPRYVVFSDVTEILNELSQVCHSLFYLLPISLDVIFDLIKDLLDVVVGHKVLGLAVPPIDLLVYDYLLLG